ncbi:flagellar biosynthesis anti-sigma factor FlgM [Maridesulfovibrio bastinii]|uniref:flagellar biosynthesis anti-sigma factor FlgM n=1 Tax=Maridesulfovibrio bastinii TaxID=47157 RepID=UPI0004163DC1|nr:flagellar biosynthesis anti-sigma factor FlgM [Maridesulfovibrio bastinii]
MKINKYTGQQIRAYDQKIREAKTESGKQSNAQKSTAATTDTINVSSQARLLGEARLSAAEAPDTRESKVNELREKVRNGTYRPDIKKTAMNLVRDEIDFLS